MNNPFVVQDKQDNNWLYTAVFRWVEIVVIVGLSLYVDNTIQDVRLSNLEKKLTETLARSERTEETRRIFELEVVRKLAECRMNQ